MGNIAAGDAIGAGAETEMGTAMAAGGGMNVTCIRMRGKTKKKVFVPSVVQRLLFVCLFFVLTDFTRVQRKENRGNR